MTNLCKCGCGGLTSGKVDHGRIPEYINHHRLKDQYLDKNPGWKGGRTTSSGYVKVLAKGHPRADRIGYVYEHILVYEEYYKCCVLSWCVVHHINGIRNDNRKENLRLLSNQSEHIKHHRPWGNKTTIDTSDRRCIKCNGHTYISKTLWKDGTKETSHARWIHIGDGWICNKCYMDEYHRLKKKDKYPDAKAVSLDAFMLEPIYGRKKQ